MIPVFDGHNDALLRLWRTGDIHGDGFFSGGKTGHLDWPKAQKGGFAGGFFAMFTPSSGAGNGILNTATISHAEARAATDQMFAIAHDMAAAQPDRFKLCHDAAGIRSAMATGQMAVMLHIEGAEAIRDDLGNLDEYYAKGLRSIGPVWSRSNHFGHGVPFLFPAGPDQGPGLTPAGRDLVAACNRKGIMIDLSHINEAGFWDIARLSTAPLVATHSNVHAICQSSRNLTSRQLDAIAASNGLVGVNFAVGFLRPDGARDRDTSLEVIIRHLDALLEVLGERGVALGSDFDGAEIPLDLADASALPNLTEAMRKAGYGDALIRRLAHENWLDMIARISDQATGPISNSQPI